jgi:hypothetical protein
MRATRGGLGGECLPKAYSDVSPYIPATLRPWNHPIRSRFSLQIGHFGAIAQLAERLDRTQEVGGSNPPSSMNVKSLHMALPATAAESQSLSNRVLFSRNLWH